VEALVVPVAWGALLLVPAGVAKLTRPAPTERALRAIGWPGAPSLVRGLGAVEVIVAAAALVSSVVLWPALVALLYAGFTAFVLRALWRNAPLRSCGCFGATGTPPSLVHVGICSGLAITNALAASDRADAPLAVLRNGGTDAVVLVLVGLVGAVAFYVLLTHPIGPRAIRTPRQRSTSGHP
jgi:hypothetical protein